MAEVTAKSRTRIFYGWWIVAISAFFNLIVAGAFFHGFTAFFNPLRGEFGWKSAETALGFSLQRLEGGFAGPIVGFLFDRLGPRKLVIGGMAVAGAGLMLMSRIDSLMGFYATFLITAIGISFGWAGPPMYCVSHWFAKKRTLALSYLIAGSSLGGIIVPLLVIMIEQTGWRTSLLIVGATFWLVTLPVAIMLRHRPENVGLLPDGEQTFSEENNSPAERPVETTSYSVSGTLKTRAFWLISLSYMLSHLVATAVSVLEMPHFENVGISREIAGVAVTFTTLMTLVGNLLSGYIGDKWRKSRIIAAAFALQCLGVVLFAFVGEAWHLIPFVVVYGVGFGATMPLRTSLMADYFGRKSLGTILGCLMSVTVIGAVLSPAVAGWFFDVSGSYRFIFLMFALLAVVSVPSILLARKPVPAK